jgi:hypothetical protein
MTKMPAGKDQSAAAVTKVEVEAAKRRGEGPTATMATTTDKSNNQQ